MSSTKAIDNPRTITFIEKFRFREAFEFHCKTSYIKHFFDNTASNLMDDVVVMLYEEVPP
jgi:quinol monooxygenase YgiN